MLEEILKEIIEEDLSDERVVLSYKDNEDAVILNFPKDKLLVQTIDFFTPVVNDPYKFGQIAAANSLSDIYAMGADPYSAMNIVCFPAEDLSLNILKKILKGGFDKLKEADVVMAGGHSVEDKEIKYGLAVVGMVDRDKFATNKGFKPGHNIVITKPIGSGVLSTAIKAKWEGWEEMEEELYRWASRLNISGCKIIKKLDIKGATDITGFGLGGHILEVAKASDVEIEIWMEKVPIMKGVKELSNMGLLPEGAYKNKKFYLSHFYVERDRVYEDELDILFDPQTSGGLILSIPDSKMDDAKKILTANGDIFAHIGVVRERKNDYFVKVTKRT